MVKSRIRQAAIAVASIMAVGAAFWLLAPANYEIEVDSDVAPQSGQLVVAPGNPRWLARAGGQPFFLCGPGDPEDFLYRGARQSDGTRVGDQEALIEKLVAHGGNCIYMQVVRSHGGDGQADHNPFINSDPANGLDEDILQQWDRWFTMMDENDIVIYLQVYDDGADIFNTWRRVSRPEYEFVRDLVNRFEGYRNLIWCVAEEYYETLSPTRASTIAKIIRAADDYNHPIAIHKLHGLSFEEFADDPNLDQFAIQWNQPTAEAIHRGVVQAWSGAAGRYNLNMAEALGHIQDTTAKSWACAMAGAYVMVYEMDIANTPPALLAQCRILQNFFEATNYVEMAPADQLAADATTYVLAKPGDAYIAYSNAGDGPLGLRDLPAGRYDLTWVDCLAGEQFVEPDIEARGGPWSRPRPAGCGDHCAVSIRKQPAVR